MDVSTNADSISDSQTASDIITNTRSISTTVQLKSGQTVLLGGMVDNRESDSDSSVPWVSKIPLIGALFTSKSSNANSRAVTKLVLVLTGVGQAAQSLIIGLGLIRRGSFIRGVLTAGFSCARMLDTL